MCCGQKRAELRTNPTQEVTRSVPRSIASNNQTPVVRAHALMPPATRNYAQTVPASNQLQTAHQQTVAPMPALQTWVSVRYTESSPVRVLGPITGRQYEFSGSHPVQPVHPGDAASLLSTRFFRRA